MREREINIQLNSPYQAKMNLNDIKIALESVKRGRQDSRQDSRKHYGYQLATPPDSQKFETPRNTMIDNGDNQRRGIDSIDTEEIDFDWEDTSS